MILLKWSRLQILQAENQTISFDESIDFEPAAFAKMTQIRGLHDVTVSEMFITIVPVIAYMLTWILKA